MTSREAALSALERCRRDRAWSNASIDSIIKKYSLDEREAALAARLCLGVLQNTALCDHYIDSFCTSKTEPKVRDILRMGVYQLLFLDKIPARAAVHECVELCKSTGFSRAAGLVNAVLRKIAAGDLPEIPGEGSAGYLSIRYSHPLWLCEKLVNEQGYEFAKAFFAANNTPPPVGIQVNTLRVSAETYERALVRMGIEYTRFEGVSGCFELPGGSIPSLPGYDDGLFYVQDRAARLAVEIAAPEPGMSVLDACAAPGGKSFAAAIRMNNTGSIQACDIHEKKLSRIRNGAEWLGIDILSTSVADAGTDEPEKHGKFDLVIADVPCSGLGVIRKKPEIRMKSAEEIASLPETQGRIIKNLASYVCPGGCLLYSTCTILKEENEKVVGSFLKSNSSFAAEAFTAGDIKAESGMYTFWPNVNGTDGFFVAKLRRIR